MIFKILIFFRNLRPAANNHGQGLPRRLFQNMAQVRLNQLAQARMRFLGRLGARAPKKGYRFMSQMLKKDSTSQLLTSKPQEFQIKMRQAIFEAFNNEILDFLDEERLAENAENIIKAVFDTSDEAMIKAGDYAEELVLEIREKLEQKLGRKLLKVDMIKDEPLEEEAETNGMLCNLDIQKPSGKILAFFDHLTTYS